MPGLGVQTQKDPATTFRATGLRKKSLNSVELGNAVVGKAPLRHTVKDLSEATSSIRLMDPVVGFGRQTGVGMEEATAAMLAYCY